jgi:hypothetical protein
MWPHYDLAISRSTEPEMGGMTVKRTISDRHLDDIVVADWTALY